MSKGKVGTGKKRCTRGKSCGATCIGRSKTCIMGMRDTLSSDMGKLSNNLSGKPAKESPSLPG